MFHWLTISREIKSQKTAFGENLIRGLAVKWGNRRIGSCSYDNCHFCVYPLQGKEEEALCKRLAPMAVWPIEQFADWASGD